MTVELQVCFRPVDSWFFSDSRGHDAIGSDQLNSGFPPPYRTLIGALRTRIGDTLGINWSHHATDEGDQTPEGGKTLSSIIGDETRSGEIVFSGTSIILDDEPLYRTPAMLLKARDTDKLMRLIPGEPVRCDIADGAQQHDKVHVHLPTLGDSGAPAQSLADTWLRASGISTLLGGGTPSPEQLVTEDHLLLREPRTGIGRDNTQATVVDGLFYRTSHLRLRDNVGIVARISLPDALAEKLRQDIARNPLQRLGGEGRMASLSLKENTDDALPPAPKTKKASTLVLITDQRLPANSNAGPVQLPGFVPETVERDGKPTQVWRGTINDIAISVHCGAQTQVIREGGWSLRTRAPTKTQSYLAPGSCYFASVDDKDVQAAIEALHGYRFPDQSGFGAGRLLCGIY